MSEQPQELQRILYHSTMRWMSFRLAPKDGTHIICCKGPYTEHWTFDQSPPMVVHYWNHPGEEGFYLSHGLVEGSYNDVPVEFTHWRLLEEPTE